MIKRNAILESVRQLLAGSYPFEERVYFNRSQSIDTLPAIHVVLRSEESDTPSTSNHNEQRELSFFIRVYADGDNSDIDVSEYTEIIEDRIDSDRTLGDNAQRLHLEDINFDFDERTQNAYAELNYTATYRKD